ncbi:hypothetical protein RN001_006640 [Aquatica leii]|uniref:Uncharacterized protein n=1 Tax=Aquatica leii TaxID=1421715 RepID=A0AAN7SBJ8_9COLE|nr:hypothetical protein RN001_006640 [Aquatica leii]
MNEVIKKLMTMKNLRNSRNCCNLSCSQNGTEITTDGEIAETIKNWLTLAKLGLQREETKDAQENTDKLIK